MELENTYERQKNSGSSLSRSDSLKESRSRRGSNARDSPSKHGTPKKSVKKNEGRMKLESDSLPCSNYSTPKRRVHCGAIKESELIRSRESIERSPPDLGLNICGNPAPRRTERAHSLPGVTAVRRSSIEAQQRKRRERAARNSLGGREPLLDLALISDFESNQNRDLSTERCSACSAALTDAVPSTSRGCNSNRTYSIRRYSLQNSARSHSTSHIVEDSPRKNQRERPRSRKSSLSSSKRISPRFPELEYSSEVEMTSGLSSRDRSPGRLSPKSTLNKTGSSRKSECSINSSKPGYNNHGEWADFWTTYNNSRASSSRQKYYDECPTPYLEQKNLTSDRSSKKSDRSDLSKSLDFFGVSLTTGETKEIIGCAHKLAEVLTLALERNNSKKDKSSHSNKCEGSGTKHCRFNSSLEQTRQNSDINHGNDEDVSL